MNNKTPRQELFIVKGIKSKFKKLVSEIGTI